MTAPITSNEPTTTRLHHYAGHYSVGARKPATRLSDTGVAFASPCQSSSETAIAFARPCQSSSETAIAFARAGRAPIETDIAFAGEKWVFWVRFSVAEVMAVSMVAVLGRAVVMVVSCWPVSVVAEVSLVSTSPRHSCLCAKKFALRAQNGPK
ncbi:hypothetical protein O3645_06510 [Pauljensenia sp. 27098_8_107]